MKLWCTLWASSLLVFTQIVTVKAQACGIVSITSPSANSLDVKWKKYTGATSYFLDVRIVNNTSFAPVVVSSPSSSTERLVLGLRPGTVYNVTMKVFQFYYVTCQDSQVTLTVPATSQITFSKALSSTSIQLEWNSVPSAQNYLLVVENPLTQVKYNSTIKNASTVVSKLQPSTSYSCSVYCWNLAGFGARSPVRIVLTLVQPPAVINVQPTGVSTARILWQKVDKVLLYQVTVTSEQAAQVYQKVFTTMATYLDISNLQPCSMYKIGVSCFNALLELGEPASVNYTTTTVSQVTSIWPDYNCTDGTVTVQWLGVDGANFYQVLAADGTGAVLSCNSTSTSCQITGLTCGASYEVSITAVSGNCHSTSISITYFDTIPCPPINLSIFRECSSNMIIVSWAPTNNTDSYVTTSLASNGVSTECRTTDTMCFFTDTYCGLTYEYAVYSVSGVCNSDISSAVQIKTAPCQPMNVTTITQCLSSNLVTTWNAAPGALSYLVEAQSNDGRFFTCNTTTTSCTMFGLPCGQSLSMWITSTDGSCSSDGALGHVVETVPCKPQNVSVVMDCKPDSVTLHWDYSPGALLFVASAVYTDGSLFSCTTSFATSCQIRGLSCGYSYSVFVVASNMYCNSSKSMQIPVKTAPCVPQNVQANLQCDANTAVASWGGVSSAIAYNATIIGPGGFYNSCSTAQLNCSFGGLQCSQIYNLSVVSFDNKCQSNASSMFSLVSVPCQPGNVTANLDCDTNAAMVSWSATPWVRRYVVFTHVGIIRTLACSTANTSCQLGQLQCGTVYNITVAADDGTCYSSHSRVSIPTAPCPPVIVNTSIDCNANTVTLSWLAGADSFDVIINGTSSLGNNISCHSANGTCDIKALSCGQIYSVRATARSMQCDGAPSPSTRFVSVPCAPAAVNTQYDCGINSALITWDSLAVGPFLVKTEGGGFSSSFVTVGNNYTFTGLPCGSTYNVTSMVMANQCNSSQSWGPQFQTIPCAPQNVSAALLCANNTALVHWLGSPGAVAYNVTAVGKDGDMKSCFTQGTSCALASMHCGQTYTVTVTPFSNTCSGQRASIAYISGPCPPGNVTTSLNCEENVVSVTWNPIPGAESYLATAISTDGHMLNCSSNSTICSFQSLYCATNYTITVSSVAMGCSSQLSLGTTILTAICPIQDLYGNTSCDLNTISVMWNGSSTQQVTYILFYETESRNGSYTTTNNFYSIVGMQCGEQYSFWVLAGDKFCNSTLSPSLTVSAVPCPPSNLTATAECGLNSANISWTSHPGSQAHTVQLVGKHGHNTSCTSNGTSCLAELDCGHSYAATILSFSDNCNSAIGYTIYLNSAPCLPENVTTELDCVANILGIQWQDTADSSESYTALAIASDGSKASCNSTSSNCTIQNLHCGQVYSIVVTTPSANCSRIRSSEYQVYSAPCKPQDPVLDLNCSSNMAHVSWKRNSTDQWFLAQAVDQYGVAYTCDSPNSSCTFSNFSCGTRYSITVVGMTEQCTSNATPAMDILTGPCIPVGVQASIHCDTGFVDITWAAAQGATGYRAQAVGTNGHTTACTTNSTACGIQNLQCGQDYSIVIFAMLDSTCESLPSDPITIAPVPCPMTNLTASLDCNSNVVWLSWSPGNGTLFYNASLMPLDGSSLLSCTSNSSGCNITSLKCGQSYNISVVGQGTACPCPKRSWITLDTAPCLPTLLSVGGSCYSSKLNISWTNAKGANSYTAVAAGSNGQTTTCNSTTTTCDISGLLCGQDYNISVMAINDMCSSNWSQVLMHKSAPCVPQLVETSLNCPAGGVNVSWQSSAGAEHYYAFAENVAGHVTTCNTDSVGCFIPDLMCGVFYSVMVAAGDETCISPASPTQNILGAPCPPPDINVFLDCLNNTALVSWTRYPDGLAYRAEAVSADGHASWCNSTDINCAITDLLCGTLYNVTVSSSKGNCTGPQSDVHIISTAPCIPEDLKTNVSCSNNVANITWASSQGALVYWVEAEGNDGQTVNCSSVGRSCTLTTLNCGQEYSITLRAQDNKCTSSMSPAVNIQTVPCAPEPILTKVDCGLNVMTVSWNKTLGVDFYNTTLVDGNGQLSTCQTNGSQCNMTGLTCGTIYSVTVTAVDHQCAGLAGTVVHTHSVPCQPQSIQAAMDCKAQMATVSWYNSSGALSYVAIAVTATGQSVVCNTNGTSCVMGALMCGEEYSVKILAWGDTCNSTSMMTYPLVTKPCVPQNVTVYYNQTLAVVSWERSKGATFYTTDATDSEGKHIAYNSTTTACILKGLLCGKAYNVTVTAHNDVCFGTAASHPVVLLTEPCPPNNVQATVDCSSHNGTVTWQQSHLAVGYVASLKGQGGDSASCYTPNTYCGVDVLRCGSVYNVSVKAVGAALNSSDSAAFSLTTHPCVPDGVWAQVYCDVDAVLVTWSYAGDNGDIYTVTAQGADGQLATCTTQNNSCTLANLHCGQAYDLNMTSTNTQCSVTSVPGVTFQNRPCAPQQLEVDIQCGSRTALLSWEDKAESLSYVATATSIWGTDVRTCNSTSTACLFPDLLCGESYNFTVAAHDSLCSSVLSNSTKMHTEPCPPANVTVLDSCDSTAVYVSWHAPATVHTYLVTVAGNLGYVETYNSTGAALKVELPCGQEYNVTVAGQADGCVGAGSSPLVARTALCVPTHLAIDTLCQPGVRSATWAPSDGARSYAAQAESQDGYNSTCVSNRTFCAWTDLNCGSVYSVLVTAKNDDCASAPGDGTVIYTAPCIPQNLSVTLNCSQKTGVLTWNASRGATGYAVVAASGSGARLELDTNSTSVSLWDLRCDDAYNLTVAASGPQCSSSQSPPVILLTEPCPPLNVKALVDCSADALLVRWDPQPDADSFHMQAVAAGTGNVSCHTEGTQCSVSVPCGLGFAVSVTTVRDGCESKPSPSVQVSSVPCVPQSLAFHLDCQFNDVYMMWSADLGANTYNTTGRSERGHVVSCLTNSTQCTVRGLNCGSLYNFTVTPSNGQCNGPPSSIVQVMTVPCVLDAINLTTSCHSSDIQVVWNSTDSVTPYIAVAEGSDNSALTCNSTTGSCGLAPARCGVQYTVVVEAVSNRCTNLRSPPSTISTAPCAPQNVVVQDTCDPSGASMSWAGSPVAQLYRVAANGTGGDARAFNATSSGCSLAPLQCGSTYSVSVTALAGSCVSPPSANVAFDTAPCQPVNVYAEFDCVASAATLTWSHTWGAVDYLACVWEGNATTGAHCHTATGTNCTFGGLSCGTVYNFSVQASDGTCNSSFSRPLAKGAAPCPPANVSIQLLPMQAQKQALRITWGAVTCPGVEYLVEATGRILGDSHALCELSSYWTDRTSFELLLPCGTTYNVTVRSRRGATVSRRSAHVSWMTAPCPPPAITYQLINGSALLTWSASVFAASYTVYERTATGLVTICQTQQLYCPLAGVNITTVAVTASNAAGQSNPSQDILHAAPARRRRDLHVESTANDLVAPRVEVGDVSSDSLLLTWAPVEGAAFYTVTVTGPTGGPHALEAYGETSVVVGLQPATRYCVTVSAKNAAGTGPPSRPVCRSTAANM